MHSIQDQITRLIKILGLKINNNLYPVKNPFLVKSDTIRNKMAKVSGL